MSGRKPSCGCSSAGVGRNRRDCANGGVYGDYSQEIPMGGRWTPLARWNGLGRLRDSAGEQYGLYVRFSPYVDIDLRDGRMTDCCQLSGNAPACTAGGAEYRFDGKGGVAAQRGWQVELRSGIGACETTQKVPAVRRMARTDLVLDDRKSMYHHFLPDGNLTPNQDSATGTACHGHAFLWHSRRFRIVPRQPAQSLRPPRVNRRSERGNTIRGQKYPYSTISRDLDYQLRVASPIMYECRVESRSRSLH
jgi:hypothetical protein